MAGLPTFTPAGLSVFDGHLQGVPGVERQRAPSEAAQTLARWGLACGSTPATPTKS